MNKVPTYEALISKKIIAFLGSQPHIGVLDMYDEENLRMIVSDEDGKSPTPYLLPRTKLTIIGENADEIMAIMKEAREAAEKRAAEKAAEGGASPARKVIPASAIPGL
jgi:hypothetical protein